MGFSGQSPRPYSVKSEEVFEKIERKRGSDGQLSIAVAASEREPDFDR
jgi:hypothetical protein